MRIRLLLTIVASAVLCTTLSTARAQQPPTLQADIVTITAGDYPAARAVVNIEAAGGADVKSLTAANFSATVGGKAAPILSADLASSQNAPLDVVLLMDVSGSMSGEPIAQAKEAAKGLVRELAPDDRVAVMSFADAVKLVQDYTTDRARAAAAIDGLAAEGNTALYDATGAAAVKAGTSQSSRRAIILLSDGAQDGVELKTTRDEAIAAAVGAGVPFFAIGEGNDIDRAYLTQLGTASKGRYLEAPKVSDLGGLFASIGELLTSQFIVTFDASAASGLAEAPVSITLHAGAASTTAQATFKPGPAFGLPPFSVALSGIQEGETLSDPRVVTAVPDRTQGLTRVAFYVDGVNVYETDKAPYTFTFDPKAFSDHPHTVKAAAIAGAQAFESAPVAFVSRAPVVAKSTSSGGSLPVVPIAAAAALTAGVLSVAALVLLARRRRGAAAIDGPSADQRITPWAVRHRPLDAPAPEIAQESAEDVEDVGEPLGVLVARSGSLAGTEYVVGGKPVMVGSAARCGVRIRDGALAAEEARVWVRDAHLMVHKMTRLAAIAADRTSGGWTILEPGDTLDIGEHRFEFRLWTAPPPEAEDEPAEEVPNILRERDISHAPHTPRPSAAPASSLGQIWPRDGALPPTTDEGAGREQQAS
jgi:Mg-chelatase subunit ChlD